MGQQWCTFKALGHRPVGLDGSKAFCDMTHQNSAFPALHQQFLNLELGENSFDGIFANASLFHIPGQKLARVLGELHRALRPRWHFNFIKPKRTWRGMAGTALWPLHGV